jgi:hypothetical protein
MCTEGLAVKPMRCVHQLLLLFLLAWPFATLSGVAWFAATVFTGVAVAGDVPLPRPRPPATAHVTALALATVRAVRPIVTPLPTSLTPPQEAYASLPEAQQVGPDGPVEPSACQRRMSPDLAVIHPLPPIIGPGDCGALDVVRLDAIVLPDHTKVAVVPAATLRCTMAEAVTHWVREDVAPAVRELEAPLREVENYDSFECRGRNRVVGAKVSEHGLANALDVKALKLADGTVLAPTDIKVAKDLREELRRSSCGRFMTVLGPGSDGYHESHIHIDLAERKNGYHICQWDVREPVPEDEVAGDVPLPRPRPNLEGRVSDTNNSKL